MAKDAANAYKETLESLKEKIERLLILINNSPDIVCLKDGQGRWLEANDTDLKLFQLENVDYRGKKDSDLADYSPFYREAFLTCEESDELAWKKGTLCRAIETIPKPDGSHVILDIYKIPLFQENGERKGLLVLGRDITALKLTEEELQANKEMLSTILNSLPQSIFWKDKEGHYLGCNEVFAKAIGLSKPEDIFGKTDYDLPWSQEEAQAYRQDDNAVITSAQPKLHIIEPLQQADGQRLWIDTSKVPLLNNKKEVTGVIGIYDDISEAKRIKEDLLKEKLFTDAVLNSIPGLLYLYDSEGHLIRWNKQHEKITGYSSDELSRMHLLDWYRGQQQDIDTITAGVQRALKEGFADAEANLITKNGSRIPFYFTAVRLEIEGQLYFTGIGIDLTQRKHAEEVLRQERDFSTAVLQTVGALIVVLNAKGQVVQFNRACEETTGYRLDEVKGHQFWDTLLLPEERAGVMKTFGQLCSGQFPNRYENYWLAKDGSKKRIAWSNTVLQDQTGKVAYVIGTGIDVTDVRLAEKALRESEERLTLALKATTDAIWDWHIPSGKGYFSPRYYEMLGYNNEEFDPSFSTFLRLIHPDDITKIDGVMQRLAKEGGTHSSVEIRMKTKDNQWKWLLSRGEIIEFDANKNPVRMVGTHTDISERKKAEEERAKLETQLRQSQKMEAVGQLAGGIAHDFNNLLLAIQGYTDLAIKNLPAGSNRATDHLKKVQIATERAVALTRQLLVFSRRSATLFASIDLNELISSFLKLLERLIGEQIHIVWHPKDGINLIRADSSQIEQVLMNLCLNSRDAMPNGGTLTIEVGNVTFTDEFCHVHPWAKKGDFVCLSVNDNGIGMSKEVMEHLFEPFFTTKEIGHGTGLGLATIYGIVQAHNGLVQAYSEPNKGSSFNVYIPIAQDNAQQIHKQPAAPALQHGTETILLAEDEELVRNLAISILEEAGYKLIVAKDGEEAIELFKIHHKAIDIALLDAVMPKKSGKQVHEAIRALDPKLPVVYTSGYSFNTLRLGDLAEAGIDLIQKPYSPADLLQKIRENINRQSGRRGT